MLTGTPRAFRMRPMLAAVMPLPRELVTPPVTKTYFGIGPLCTSRWLGRRRELQPLAARERHRLVPLGTRSYPTPQRLVVRGIEPAAFAAHHDMGEKPMRYLRRAIALG